MPDEQKIEDAKAIVLRGYQWIVDARKDYRKYLTDSEFALAMDSIVGQLGGKDKDTLKRTLHLLGETSKILTETLGALQNCLNKEIIEDGQEDQHGGIPANSRDVLSE